MVLAGCASTSFVPHRAEYKNGVPKVALRAVRGYDGDIETLTAAGGAFMGTFKTKKWSGIDLKAAEIGGTHTVLLGVSVYKALVGTSCETWGTASYASTSCSQQSISIPVASIGVFRVDPSRWSELPPALQPGVAPTELLACNCHKRDWPPGWRLACPTGTTRPSDAEAERLCAVTQ